jgi:hypothetical protein
MLLKLTPSGKVSLKGTDFAGAFYRAVEPGAQTQRVV